MLSHELRHDSTLRKSYCAFTRPFTFF